MGFKSRFVRSLPVLALMAGLLVPYKPVAAAEGPYTPATPGVSAASAAEITAGDPAADSDELDAAGKPRKLGHGKKRLLTAASDESDTSSIRRRKPRHVMEGLLTVDSDELDAAGKLRRPGHGKKRLLTAASDESNAMKGRRKPRRV